MPPEHVAEWKQAGLDASALPPAEKSGRVALKAPGIAARGARASATRRPWIDANGWRYQRQPQARYFETAPAGVAALAAAEAFAHGADLVLAIDPGDLESFGQALAFSVRCPRRAAGLADLAVVDDGSFAAGELMNLLGRRNLLFRPVRARRASCRSRWSSARKPIRRPRRPIPTRSRSRSAGSSPTSDARCGSSAARWCWPASRETGRRRLHLLNYGRRAIEGLRVRLRGRWTPGDAHVLQHGRQPSRRCWCRTTRPSSRCPCSACTRSSISSLRPDRPRPPARPRSPPASRRPPGIEAASRPSRRQAAHRTRLAKLAS